MKQLLVAFCLIGGFILSAQDLIPAENGDIKITPVYHGSLVIEYDGTTYYVDPHGPGTLYADFPSPNFVLITDIHGDHHNPETLDALDVSSSWFVVPMDVLKKMPDSQRMNAVVLNNGDYEEEEFGVCKITALPMYNLPETADSRHPKGRGNGYLLEIGGKRIYISGDTEDIPEMRELTGIDVAFVCMNLPYTMGVDQAADAVSEFKPKIVYPYHYRGSEGLSDVNKFESLVNKNAPSVEVRLRNWYPEK